MVFKKIVPAKKAFFVQALIIAEPAIQAEKAKEFVETCYANQLPVCVSDLVVAESYHALIYHYDVPKNKAINALSQLLSSPMIRTTGHALSVLSTYRGSGAGMVDRLIRMDFLDHVHEIVTFDKDFAKQENVRRLKA